MLHATRSGLVTSIVAGIVLQVAAQAPAFVLDEAHRLLPPSLHTLRQTALGDVDGDALPDLVSTTGDATTYAVSVWHNATNGRFTMLQHDTLLPPVTTAVALADLDGDGDRDLVATRPAICAAGFGGCAGAADRILWNDGTGHFAATGPTLPAAPQRLATSIAAGDVDGDGDQDLVFGCEPHTWVVVNPPLPPQSFSENGENTLLLNNGSGVFTDASAQLGNDKDNTRAVVLADFDGDGDLDLFAANQGQDRYYRNTGAGTFVAVPSALPTDGDAVHSAQTLDLDGDGDLDLLLHTWDGVRLLANDGTGSFGDATPNLPVVLSIVDSVFVGDFDGDGAVDIGERSGTLAIQLRNDGNGVFTHAPSANILTPNAGRLLAFDFDLDTDVDLVAPGGGYYEHTILLNDGTGAMHLVEHDLPDVLFNQLVPALADVDLDGDLDVLAPAEGSPALVYRNDGGGRFASVAFGDFTTDAGSTLDVAVGDLDGDGWPDAVTANTGLSFVSPLPGQVYRNTGTGRLDRVSVPPVHAFAVALGDLDGDGDLDVFWGRAPAGLADVVWRNLGGMQFAAIPGAVTDTNSTTSVALADFDFDGDLDAAVVAWFQGGNRVLRNDGTGLFTAAPTPLPHTAGNSQHVLAVDVDGDADQDLVIANDGAPNRLYRNDGTGVFTDSSADLPQDNGRTISFAAGDFDQDGDVDLLECSFHGTVPTRALANDGSGHFTVVPGGLPVVTAYAHRFAVGDLDLDADLDAFLVTQGPPRVYWNQRRQLAWRELPRIGRQLNLDLRGAANDLWLLVASASPASVPLPGLGLLQVDIATPIVVEAGLFDAQGRASRGWFVPALPASIGQPFFWQTLHGTPLGLGNLEITTLQPN